MGAPSTIPLDVTYPGQTLDISVNLTAPTSPGIHQANFVIKNPAGLIMKIGDDSRLWAIIDVTVTGAAATATMTATLPAPTATALGAATALRPRRLPTQAQPPAPRRPVRSPSTGQN